MDFVKSALRHPLVLLVLGIAVFAAEEQIRMHNARVEREQEARDAPTAAPLPPPSSAPAKIVHGDEVHGDKNVQNGDTYNVGQVILPPPPSKSDGETKPAPSTAPSDIKFKVAPPVAPKKPVAEKPADPPAPATAAPTVQPKDRVIVLRLDGATPSKSSREVVPLEAHAVASASAVGAISPVSGVAAVNSVGATAVSVLPQGCGTASFDPTSGGVTYTPPPPPHGPMPCIVRLQRSGEPDRVWQVPIDAEP